MRTLTFVMIFACLAGCATFQARDLTFEDAVQKSIIESKGKSMILVSVHRDGKVFVANRPTLCAELETLDSVRGLPFPPAVAIETHSETRHQDVLAVMNACKKAGITRISVQAKQ